jgi:hypothetical protein
MRHTFGVLSLRRTMKGTERGQSLPSVVFAPDFVIKAKQTPTNVTNVTNSAPPVL